MQLSKKAAFARFGLDVNGYHRHINNYIDFDHVGESEVCLVATAHLSDVRDLAAKGQPGEEEKHLDPIDISELWANYKDDPTVNDITSAILSYKRFHYLFTHAFRKIKTREYKSAVGRCRLCEDCNVYMGEKLKF